MLCLSPVGLSRYFVLLGVSFALCPFAVGRNAYCIRATKRKYACKLLKGKQLKGGSFRINN